MAIESKQETTMNDLRSGVMFDESAHRDPGESICVDLGDAVAETKQWYTIQWILDNYLQFGYPA
jgi:hypothetical protein